MLSIDKACYNSNLRYENPGQKLSFAVITLLLCVGSRSIYVSSIALLTNSYLIIYKSGVSFAKFCHYMKIPMAFILLSTISIILNFSTQPLDAFAIPLSFINGENAYYITSSTDSLYFAGQLILTAVASVSSLYFISLTTPIPDILMVMQKIKIPVLFIELMLLIYRYIFILLDVADQICKSQRIRLGNKDYKTSMKSFGQLIGVLFIRAMKKSNILYDAMESRGYDGRIHVLNESYQPKMKVTIGIVAFELLLIAVIIFEKLGGII